MLYIVQQCCTNVAEASTAFNNNNNIEESREKLNLINFPFTVLM